LPTSTARLRLCAAIVLVAAGAIYLPAVGHGFVKDDFVWIARSDASSWRGLAAAFHAPTGFFRPAVSVMFGLNRMGCGLDARCYGIANFALLIACAAGVAALARGVLKSDGAALVASAIWLFNWHGINMAVLWISGRTALALVLFATFGAAAFLKRRWIAATALVAAAMLSKEEAVLLPAVLVVWKLIERRTGSGITLTEFASVAAAAFALDAAYFAVRSHSGAFTPASAPTYYRLQFAVSRFLENVVQYGDRSMTFAAAVVLAFWVIARPGIRSLGRETRRAVLFAAAWWIGGFGITMFLPTRSSLYAVFPSIGTALAAAAIVRDGWDRAGTRQRRAAIVAGLCAPFLLWPVYAARNRPAVREAELSARALQAVQESATAAGAGAGIVLRDNRSERPSFDNAFGTLVQDAADLVVRPRVSVWIDPPPTDAAHAGLTPPDRVDVVLALRDGGVVRVR